MRLANQGSTATTFSGRIALINKLGQEVASGSIPATDVAPIATAPSTGTLHGAADRSMAPYKLVVSVSNADNTCSLQQVFALDIAPAGDADQYAANRRSRHTATPVPTNTETPFPTATNTPQPTQTPGGETATPTNTPAPTETFTPVPTATNTPVPNCDYTVGGFRGCIDQNGNLNYTVRLHNGGGSDLTLMGKVILRNAAGQEVCSTDIPVTEVGAGGSVDVPGSLNCGVPRATGPYTRGRANLAHRWRLRHG